MSNRPPNVFLHPADGSDPLHLSSDGEGRITLKQGIEGLGVAPVEHNIVARPVGHGSLVKSTHLKDREVFLPLQLWGKTQDDVLKLWDRIVKVVSPLRGGAVLEVFRDGDEPRYLDVLYKSGLEGNFGETYRKTWFNVGLTLSAPSAFWYAREVALSWQTKHEGKIFISGGAQKNTHKFFPIILAPSAVAEVRDIIVDSDAEVQPIWNITGPVKDVMIENVSTGAKFRILGTLNPGETITVDTRTLDIYDATHHNGELHDRVSDESVFFTLPAGRSQVKVTGTGMTDKSSIRLQYRPLFLKGL